MKVLDLAEFYSERGGGVRAYLSQLVREGTLRGHDVVVVAPGPRDETVPQDGGRVVRLVGPPMPYDPTYHALWRLRAARGVIQVERPDVLQASSPYVAALVATSLREVPVRALVVHSDFVEAYARPVLSRVLSPRAVARVLSPAWAYVRALASRFDVTVTAGEWLADKLRAHGCPRVRCVPFGIQRAGIGPERADPTVRRALLGPIADRPDAALLVAVGRLAVEKRFAFVQDAVKVVARTRPVALVVMGDGPERATLEARAAGSHATHFLGFVKDRSRYASVLASADALVHGCSCETFGFAVGEALASGLPVVVPDAGGAAEFAAPSCAERYPAAGSPLDAAVAIHRLLDRPRDHLRRAAVEGAARIPTMEDHFRALFALYADLLDARRRA